MKKTLLFLLVLAFCACKEEAVKQPKRLIEKSKMIAIMYDLALLEAIKYQNPSVLDSNQIRPKQFLYKKYKIDSLQLAENNVYYASDYKNYKLMFDQVLKQLEQDQKKAEALLKLEEKKKAKKDASKNKNTKVKPNP